MSSVSSLLRTDHVAVALYQLRRGDAQSRQVMASSCVGEHGVESCLLSVETLMKICMEKLLSKFQRCMITAGSSCSFTGLPLPSQCRSNEGEAVVKALVDSESYPGPFKTYRLPSTATVWRDVLDIYIRFELVQRYEHQIIMKGYSHLTSCCVIDGLQPVLSFRPDIALKDRTYWELMLVVERDGWCIRLWVPRSKVKPIDLEAQLNAENNKLYFNGRSCEICSAYLHCVLRRAELLEGGALGTGR